MKTPDEEDTLAGDGLCPLSDPSLPVPFEVEQSLGFQLRRIATLLGAEVDRRMEPLGLTDAQEGVLNIAFYQGTGLAASLGELAQQQTEVGARHAQDVLSPVHQFGVHRPAAMSGKIQPLFAHHSTGVQ